LKIQSRRTLSIVGSHRSERENSSQNNVLDS